MNAISYNNKDFNLEEPFKGLFTQGMVCHETYKDDDGNWISPDELITINGEKFLKGNKNQKVKIGPSESMSKSKKNTIDPEKIINDFGADSVRLFILSDSPPEKDVQWSDEGIMASYKFIQKLWVLNKKIMSEIEKNHITKNSDEITKITTSFISKINNNLITFSYNKMIANLHEVYSELNKTINKNYPRNVLIENYEKILTAMIPIIPHFANECLSLFSNKTKIEWPKIDDKFLVEEFKNFVVQVNGKTRGIIKTKRDTSEVELIKLINKDTTLNKHIKNKGIKRKIFIPNKLINIII